MSGAINAPLGEEPRFICRREGHIPTMKFTNVKSTIPSTDGRFHWMTTCARCGKWAEFSIAAELPKPEANAPP